VRAGVPGRTVRARGGRVAAEVVVTLRPSYGLNRCSWRSPPTQAPGGIEVRAATAV